jgi:hypothetical protein
MSLSTAPCQPRDGFSSVMCLWTPFIALLPT